MHTDQILVFQNISKQEQKASFAVVGEHMCLIAAKVKKYLRVCIVNSSVKKAIYMF